MQQWKPHWLPQSRRLLPLAGHLSLGPHDRSPGVKKVKGRGPDRSMANISDIWFILILRQVHLTCTRNLTWRNGADNNKQNVQTKSFTQSTDSSCHLFIQTRGILCYCGSKNCVCSKLARSLIELTCPPLFSVRNWYWTLWSAKATACCTLSMVAAVCSSVPTPFEKNTLAC